MELLIIILTAIVVVGLLAGMITIYVLITNAYAKCAQEKGYEKRKYFWLCFFFGMIGYVVVAALPDKALNDRLNVLLSKNV